MGRGRGHKNERGDDEDMSSDGTQRGKLHIPQPPITQMHWVFSEDLIMHWTAKQHSSTQKESLFYSYKYITSLGAG